MLHWRPIDVGKKPLSDELMNALKKGGRTFPCMLESRDERYLMGMADAGIDDAYKLFCAISKHGDVELTEEG